MVDVEVFLRNWPEFKDGVLCYYQLDLFDTKYRTKAYNAKPKADRKKFWKKYFLNSVFVKTNSVEKLAEYVKKNYPSTVGIDVGRKPVVAAASDKTKRVSLRVLNDEVKIDFAGCLTIGEILQKTNQKDIVVKLLAEKLKLLNSNKLLFIYRTKEGFDVGKYEAESGEGITSNDNYFTYWLNYSKEKGYYLDVFNTKKIINLDKLKSDFKV